jgi:hypothetical protein
MFFILSFTASSNDGLSSDDFPSADTSVENIVEHNEMQFNDELDCKISICN